MSTSPEGNEKKMLLPGWFQVGLAVAPVSILLAWAEVNGFDFAEESLTAAAWSVLHPHACPRTPRETEEGEEAFTEMVNVLPRPWRIHVSALLPGKPKQMPKPGAPQMEARWVCCSQFGLSPALVRAGEIQIQRALFSVMLTPQQNEGPLRPYILF